MTRNIGDREIWQRAVDMLNEIHESIGIDKVLRADMAKLAVDKIAEKHMKKLRDDIVDRAVEVRQ